METWRKLVDFKDTRNNEYFVSNMGNIKNKFGKIMTQRKRKNGYVVVDLMTTRGVHNQQFVHKLVAHAFIPYEEGKNTVDHIDFDKGNNKLTNLRRISASENAGRRRKLSNLGYRGLGKSKNGFYIVLYSRKDFGINISAGFKNLDNAKNFCIVNGIEYEKIDRNNGCLYKRGIGESQEIKYRNREKGFWVSAMFGTQEQATLFCKINNIQNNVNKRKVGNENGKICRLGRQIQNNKRELL